MEQLLTTRKPGGSGRSNLSRLLRDWLLPMGLVVALTAPLRSALADWYQVPTGSMKPTIVEGDRILVNNLAYGLRVPFTSTWVTHWNQPRRGEIVTLASPQDHKRLVKRVIGLPGDRLSIRGGRLLINGQAVVYTAGAASGPANGMSPGAWTAQEQLPGRTHDILILPGRRGGRDLPELIIPPGSYFMMGDNRDDSFDSRYFGFVRAKDIYGRAGRVVASFDPQRYYLPRGDRWMKRLI